MPFKIIRNDLTKMAVDVIVNPTNSNMYGTAGVDGMIHLAEGPWLRKTTEKLRPLHPGQVKMTKASKLPAKYIIHTVGPIWQGGKNNEEAVLMNCYKNALNLAVKNEFKSIAFPLIATGTYGYPKDEALSTAVAVISKFLMAHEIDVYLVVYDETSFQLSNKLRENIETFIDNHYVAENDLYRSPVNRDRLLRKETPIEEKDEAFQIKGFKRSLDQLDFVLGESFSDRLFRLIDEKGYTDPEVYKAANVTRQTFNKIKNKENYTPTKETIISLGMALKLNYDELIDLLKSAGYALSNNNKFDLIVRYYFENEIYDLYEMDSAIYYYTKKSLQK
jgi:O-acetyl-ADP-ribose deacetylase (regulator of RNase III)/transcriptional regulator with XRE-family HTH domain